MPVAYDCGAAGVLLFAESRLRPQPAAAESGRLSYPRDAGRSPMCSRCVCREQSGTPATHAGGACLCSIRTFSIVIHDAAASPGGAQAGAALAVALRLVRSQIVAL